MDDRGQAASDAAQLQELGYKQELRRDMGGFHNFALSFSIISVLTGGVTLYAHGLRFGGPLVMTIGWPLVTLFTLLVAASLAELASAYPTAGALYHWSAILGGKGLGFLTAWLNLVGQMAITAGIDYGMAELLVSMLGWNAQDRAVVLPVFAAILVSHAIMNHVGVRAVALLAWFSAWYHVAGVALIVGGLLIFAPKQDPGFLVTQFTNQDVPFYFYGFLVGLLQAQWTFTGYDASAHATEETVDPARNAPRGILLSVAVSGVAGYLMLLAVTLAIRDLPAQAHPDVAPFIVILQDALGTAGRVLVWIAIGAMWFCGLSSVTSNSRMLWAFARDGGMPLSRHVQRVSPRFSTPHVAIWTSVGCAIVVALNAKAYSAMIAVSTIALYASYALPILCAVRARGRGLRVGPFSLGRWSTVVNVVALAWVAIVSVLFVLPPHQQAGIMLGVILVALAIYWFGYMRKRFTGPPIPASWKRT